MKFIVASTVLCIWSTTTTATKPILKLSCGTYEEGYQHGVELAQYGWEEGGFTCDTIADFEEELHSYEDVNYPTDMDNEKSNACNEGVEVGAEDVLEEIKKECSGSTTPSMSMSMTMSPTVSPASGVIEKCSDGTDCESCLSNPECTWFQETNYCETGCGLDGCGATVCPSEIDTCEECLGGPGTPASGQWSWSPDANECLTDCMVIADASCYHARSLSDPEGYTPDFCQGFAEALDQCKGTNCESCTSNSECTWFAELGYCETMCGMNGCGATICAAETTTCEECLGSDASKQYSWSPVDSTCYESCMFAPADAPCYQGDTFDASVCEDINAMHAMSAVV